jgi:hypothetical protein
MPYSRFASPFVLTWLVFVTGATGAWFALGAARLPFWIGVAEAKAEAEDTLFLDPRSLAAIDRFEQTWSRTRTARYRIVKTERLRDGKVVVEELDVKLEKQKRVYMHMRRPIRGREIIYDRSQNPRKLWVHPGHFPDVTLHLAIRGALATHDQHHTIESIGFDQALFILRDAMRVARAAPRGERLEYWGKSQLYGRTVERVAMLTGHRKARTEAAREDESLFAFAARVAADPYVILMANPSIRGLSSTLDDDESYVVPPYYAAKCESFHDAETGMPLLQRMYTADGKLYEQYEHHDLQLDAPLSDADFDRDNPAYDF